MSVINYDSVEAKKWEQLAEWLTTKCPTEIAEMILDATFDEDDTVVFQLTTERILRRQGEIDLTEPPMKKLLASMRQFKSGATEDDIRDNDFLRWLIMPRTPLGKSKRWMNGKAVEDIVTAIHSRRIREIKPLEVVLETGIDGDKPSEVLCHIFNTPDSRIEFMTDARSSAKILFYLDEAIRNSIRTIVFGEKTVHTTNTWEYRSWTPERQDYRIDSLLWDHCAALEEVVLWIEQLDYDVYSDIPYCNEAAEMLACALQQDKIKTLRFYTEGVAFDNIYDHPLLQQLIAGDEMEEWEEDYEGDNFIGDWNNEVARLRQNGPRKPRFEVECEWPTRAQIQGSPGPNKFWPNHTVVTFRRLNAKAETVDDEEDENEDRIGGHEHDDFDREMEEERRTSEAEMMAALRAARN